MEILQMIWSNLTTENESLIEIIKVIFTFIESSIIFLLFTTILNIKYTKKSSLIFMLTLSLLAIFTKYFIPIPYNTYINMLLIPVLSITILKINVLKAILSEIIPYALSFTIAGILTYIFVNTLHISQNNITNIPIYKILISSSLYIILYLLFIAIKHFKININIVDYIKKKNNIILIINFLFGTLAIGLQSYALTFYLDTFSFSFMLINIIALLLYFIISIYSLYRTSKLEITTQNLEEEKLYNKTLTILHDNIRGFKHDFYNIVQAIGGYAAMEDIEGLKKYYSQLLEDCQRVNNLTSLNPDVINNPPIFAILTDKYHKADEQGIKINLEVFLDLKTINMKIYEFTRILGILLDNAIEASRECNEKIINIQIRKDNKINRQLLIIENTYEDKNIDVDKIFEKSFSTKPNNTGLGLWEVRQILKKNNNLNLFTTKDERFFKQQLEIYM